MSVCASKLAIRSLAGLRDIDEVIIRADADEGAVSPASRYSASRSAAVTTPARTWPLAMARP